MFIPRKGENVASEVKHLVSQQYFQDLRKQMQAMKMDCGHGGAL